MFGESSLSKGHRIDTLDSIRALYKSAGVKIRVRFRGPRRKGYHGRTTICGQMECLKNDATSFAVYQVY